MACLKCFVQLVFMKSILKSHGTGSLYAAASCIKRQDRPFGAAGSALESAGRIIKKIKYRLSAKRIV